MKSIPDYSSPNSFETVSASNTSSSGKHAWQPYNFVSTRGQNHSNDDGINYFTRRKESPTNKNNMNQMNRITYIFEQCTVCEIDQCSNFDISSTGRRKHSSNDFEKKSSKRKNLTNKRTINETRMNNTWKEKFVQYMENVSEDPCSCLDPILPSKERLDVINGRSLETFDQHAEQVFDDLCVDPTLPISLAVLLCCAWM